ncbi:MAG: type IV pilus modification protein PilV [Proteobacteria bacterium]|nr:type IV pilus modification protein PilV [Pseudomonadota bacterium]
MDVQPFLRRQSGVSLIEVMIAFFVLSVGLLGIAGLHLGSLRDNGSALYRSRAVVLAADMLDRIRSNTPGLNSYAINFAGDGTQGNCHTTDTTIASGCSASEMAQHDVWTWKRLISDIGGSGDQPPTGLPGGQGMITVTNDATTAALKTVTVTIEWTEGEDTMSLATATQLWP